MRQRNVTLHSLQNLHTRHYPAQAAPDGWTLIGKFIEHYR